MRQIKSYYQKRAMILVLFVEKWQGQCPERKGYYNKIKGEFGGRVVRVRGPAKVMCHLMFGILALTSNQMMCFLE